jgi:hypothetical protein
MPMSFEHPKKVAHDAVGKVQAVIGVMDRKKDRSVLVSGGLWLALYFIARFALESPALEGWQRVVVALLPVPVFAWFLWAAGHWTQRADELERRIQLEALAIAFPLTVLLVMTLGLLQLAIDLSMDDWSYRHIWPIICVFYLFGFLRVRSRYQ